MKNVVQAHDFDQADKAYSIDHDQRENAPLDPIDEEHFASPSAHRNSNRMKLIGSLVAVVAVTVSVFLIALSQRRVYSMEGLADRLTEVRSLYMSGRQNFKIIDQNGNEAWKSYPVWCYLQRPNRFCTNAFDLECPKDNSPTKVREYVHWIDDGKRGQQEVASGHIVSLQQIKPPQCEHEVEGRFQSTNLVKLLSESEHPFIKVDEEQRNGSSLDIYERRSYSPAENFHKLVLVWLDRSTGLPVSFRSSSIDSQGHENEDFFINNIEINSTDGQIMIPSVTGVAVELAVD